MLQRNARRKELRPRIFKEKNMNNKPQSGNTRHEAENGDSLKVKFLVGTPHGQAGEIVILSYQVALSEIASGHAVAV
jgi:hypothetical protein